MTEPRGGVPESEEEEEVEKGEEVEEDAEKEVKDEAKEGTERREKLDMVFCKGRTVYRGLIEDGSISLIFDN
jgi:hypothetical protein